ncbi:MAG: tetratricopeptide repeat protein, partial [Gemmataceae bacterium]
LDDLDVQKAQRQEDRLPPAEDAALKTEIQQVLDQMQKTQMPAAADYMRGRLLVHERQWSEAAALFERARTQLASQPDLACQANLYLGQCYEKLEEPAQMFNAFKRVADWDPTSVPALIGMAAARWAQGQLDQALAQYDVVMKQRQVPPRGWIDIARLEVQRQSQRPTPDWSDAEKALANAEKYYSPHHLEVALLRAELLVRKNKLDDARTLLEAARDQNAKEVEFWTALADLALRQNNPRQAKAILDEAQRQLKDQVSLRISRARYLIVTQGKEAAAAAAALAESRSSFSEGDQAKLLGAIADQLYRVGDTPRATQLWQAMTQLPTHKTDLRLRLLLFDLAMKANDDARMQATLADVRGIEGAGGTHHRYGQSLYLIWQARKTASQEERVRRLQEARGHLDQVLTQRPSWPAVFLARAEIAELNGNQEQAIKDLQEAIKNGENSPSVIRRLVALLTQRGRDGEAQFLLAKLQQSVLYNSDLGKLAVVVALRRGEEGQAIEMMRRAVREDTSDPKELVWMSQVLATARRPAEAEKILRQAIKSAGQEPGPWVALVQFLMTQGRADEAIQTIERAQAQIAADRRDLGVARCYDLVGKPREAMECYKRALAAGKDDPTIVKEVASAHLAANRPREAEPLLRRLWRGEVSGTPAADVAWARRALAMVLANGTDYQRFTEALDLVGLKLDATGRLAREQGEDESTENRRARARVLASQNQRQFRQRAIEALEDLARAKALTPEDEFVLAVLYEAEGQVRKSQEKLKALVAPPTRTPQYLAQYAMSLITTRKLTTDLDEAEKILGWLDELERQRQAGANGFASVELRARLLEARGKGEEAITLLRRHVTREGAKPEEVVLLLSAMTRQKRFKEAFALCEQTWKDGRCMPEVVGGISVALLRVMDPTDAQVATVEQHLLQAIEKKPASTVLLMHQADLCDKRGQYDRAADLYRQVLKREPNNVVALNNLAWLLAQRSGNAQQALAHINTAGSGMGRRADLLDTRGVVHLALKDAGSALTDFKEASQEAPTPTRLFHMALAYHESRDTAKARETLREAKDKGLQVTSLHPVEQERARQVLQEYGLR